MPNARLNNISPNVGVKSITPNVKVSIGTREQISPATTTTFGGAGYPLGILMAITYTKAQTFTTPAVTQGILAGPNVRISNL